MAEVARDVMLCWEVKYDARKKVKAGIPLEAIFLVIFRRSFLNFLCLKGLEKI